MNEDFLKNFQEELRDQDLDYKNNSIYGMALLLDSALRDDFTPAEAVNELIQNSNLEISGEVVHTDGS